MREISRPCEELLASQEALCLSCLTLPIYIYCYKATCIADITLHKAE
jgi:hypothetical protein